MASFELIASSTSSQSLGASETGIVGVGVTLSGSIGLTGDNTNIVNAGAIMVGTSQAISGSSFSGLNLNNAGLIMAIGNAINVGTSGSSTTADSDITNSGTISSVDGTAIDVGGGSVDIHNTGTITSGSFAIQFSGNNVANETNEVFNGGLIAAGGAIYVSNGKQTTIKNVAEIQGNIQSTLAYMGITNEGEIFGTIYGGSNGLNVNNTGTIYGNVQFGDTTNGYLVNYSRITGQVIVDDAATDARIDNHGTIGSITMGGSDCDINNWGTVSDRIFGGDGNDQISNRGQMLDDVNLNAGDDTFYGGSGFSTRVFGDAGNDGIYGGRADENLIGDVGDDSIGGADGHDYLSGGSGEDEIYGGNGNDWLYQDAGNGALFGGAGNDSLSGGIGRDTLQGDLGRDIFTFGSVDFSPPSGPDRITDFKRGQDKIDLQYLITDTFRFAGKAGFTGGAVESVRYKVVGNTAQVLIDSDGDRDVDLRINLTGINLLTAGDFIL
jgi:Ca2+-binding RTX toxin-like protein